MPGLQVDVWIDPLCPFCYVATERAEWLTEQHGAQVTWHPFDLHPEYPPEGISRDVLRARLPGADEYTVRMFEENGLPFTGLPERIPNSRAAQRVAIAVGTELLPRLAAAYWNGRDIGDPEVVAAEALAFGADEITVREVLATDAHLDTLLEETRQITESGATGVPAWVLDGRVLVPGAQPHEVFDQVVSKLAAA
jgi:predicted DsbA family dithiol-disulfide isomerase